VAPLHSFQIPLQKAAPTLTGACADHQPTAAAGAATTAAGAAGAATTGAEAAGAAQVLARHHHADAAGAATTVLAAPPQLLMLLALPPSADVAPAVWLQLPGMPVAPCTVYAEAQAAGYLVGFCDGVATTHSDSSRAWICLVSTAAALCFQAFQLLTLQMLLR